jgi:hypothetical protein
MSEEIDYSEECKYDLFESVGRERMNWGRCIVSGTAPSFDSVKKQMESMDLSISRKDYEKICKEMNLKTST